jgi:hypothetical protein
MKALVYQAVGKKSSRRAAKASNRGTDRRDRQDIEDHDLQY